MPQAHVEVKQTSEKEGCYYRSAACQHPRQTVMILLTIPVLIILPCGRYLASSPKLPLAYIWHSYYYCYSARNWITALLMIALLLHSINKFM